MIRLKAPAKLNLYLRVVGKRSDGYHELETIFERIDLSDELTFEAKQDGLTLTSSDKALDCGEDNLVLRAAKLLRKERNITLGAHIHLDKRIPIAAGLGGGSSDAATTLLGLNNLWECKLPHSRLLELAAQLGADVPFFLYNIPFALGRGRGDECSPIISGMLLAHILVIPSAHLSTKEVFTALDRNKGFSLTGKAPSATIMRHALSNGSLDELAKGLWNDLEPEAIRRCPFSARILPILRNAGCIAVQVSGSGPSVFGICRDTAHARGLARQLKIHLGVGSRLEIVHTAKSIAS